jgi:poly-gamma-glutamate capsule biosynthesis protein CapA/YwtB (metallophosphatase superfamily)
MDYGVESLRQTLQAEIDSGFSIIGIGANDTEAYAPLIADIRGQRVAVVAATQVLDGSLANAWTATPTQPGLASAKPIDRLVRAVAEARTQADTVAVFLHWGLERATCPTGDQQSLAETLVDAGADIVVGGTPIGSRAVAAWATQWCITAWATSLSGPGQRRPAVLACSW